MLDVFSLNTVVGSTATIPFNNTVIEKGTTAVLTAPGSVQLNKRGIYMVECSASISPSTAGTVAIQLSRNGVLQPQAQSLATGETGDIVAVGFSSLVPVS